MVINKYYIDDCLLSRGENFQETPTMADKPSIFNEESCRARLKLSPFIPGIPYSRDRAIKKTHSIRLKSVLVGELNSCSRITLMMLFPTNASDYCRFQYIILVFLESRLDMMMLAMMTLDRFFYSLNTD